MAEIIIDPSQDSFYNQFNELIYQIDSIAEGDILKFPENWVETVSIKFTGSKFDGTLTTQTMTGLLKLQQNYNRIYCVSKYGTPDTKKLTKEDKARVAILVKVEHGSSLLEIVSDFKEAIEEAISRMTGKQIVAAVAIIAAAYSSGHAFDAIKDYKIEENRLQCQVKIAEFEAERDQIVFEERRAEIEHNTDRDRLALEERKLEINSNIEIIEKITELSEATQRNNVEMVKEFVKSDFSTVEQNNTTYAAEDLSEIVKTERIIIKSHSDILTGDFSIRNINLEGNINIDVIHIDSGTYINRVAVPEVIQEDPVQMQALKDSIELHPVFLRLIVVKRGEEIKEAYLASTLEIQQNEGRDDEEPEPQPL